METLQILKSLAEGGGWANHPATKMWRGYEMWLVQYGVAICDEWISRGYRDTCRDKILAYAGTPNFVTSLDKRPHWLGDTDFHSSHQSNLIRKDPAHYGPFFPGVPDDLPYVWPVP